MRQAALALALLAVGAGAARADAYLLVCQPGPCRMRDGTTQPGGTAVARLLWDGRAPFTPHQGYALLPDDGRPVYRLGAP